MSSARHARPRLTPPDPVGPTPRARHRAPARPAALHPAVVGAAAAAMAVGGVAVVRSDGSGGAATVSMSAVEEPGRLLAGTVSTDSAAASRDSVRDALPGKSEVSTAVAAGAGKHRKADTAEQAAAAATAAAKAKAKAKACGFSAANQRTPELNKTQRRNARTIVDVALERGLPPRAAVIALATAQQESELLNINYGDRDSLGLFQQRPSMGWGSPSQVRTPEYAAKAFYSALVEVGGWQRLPLTVAAQRVQRSAFGWAYARWEALAADAVDDLLDVPADELTCSRG